MRILGVVSCLALLFLQDAIGQDDAGVRSALEAQLERFAAMVDEDIVALGNLLEDDLTYSHTTGWTETKPGFLSTVDSQKIDYVSARPREVTARIYGDIAVITGLSDMDLVVRGESISLTIKFLEVSRRVDGAWRLVAWQSVRNTAE